MTSCVLLGGPEFLQQHGAGLAATLAALTGNVNERGMLLLFPVYEVLLQVLSPLRQPLDDVTICSVLCKVPVYLSI